MEYTLLIADDEPLEREALEHLLQREASGAPRLLVAPNGTIAAELGSANRVDIAFLDIRMPGMSGLDAAGVIRERNPAARLVFLSAFDYFEYAREAIRLRAEDYLIKPVEDEAVVRVLQRLVKDLDGHPRSGSERLQEATRFVESEILDDLIQGESDPEQLEHALHLLEIEDLSGYALAVRPDLENYPFRLETAAQRRAVILRYLRGLKSDLNSSFQRILLRARPDEGILLCLGELTEDASRCIEDSLGRLSASTGLNGVHRVSARFGSISDVSGILPALRRDLRSPPVPLETAGETDHRPIRQLLTALLQNDVARVRDFAENVWLEAVTTENVLDRVMEVLCFLRQSVRMHGMEPGPLSIDRTDRFDRRDELHARFIQEIRALLPETAARETGQARTMKRWIREHYREAISLADLAEHLGVSVHHCSRTFSRETGIPFSRFLNMERVRQAGTLLVNTTMSVKEIAEQVGFRDPNYLTRVFTDLEGVTPRDYRAQRR